MRDPQNPAPPSISNFIIPTVIEQTHRGERGWDVTLRYAFPAAGLEEKAMGTLLMLVVASASSMRGRAASVASCRSMRRWKPTIESTGSSKPGGNEFSVMAARLRGERDR